MSEDVQDTPCKAYVKPAYGIADKSPEALWVRMHAQVLSAAECVLC